MLNVRMTNQRTPIGDRSRSATRRPLKGLALIAAGLLAVRLPAQELAPARHPKEREGNARLIHRADVLRDRSTNSAGPMQLWPVLATPEARMNYVEVSGRSGWHFHPDADHKLYVLEGRVLVFVGSQTNLATAGDLIIIPPGVRHRYDVPVHGERALLLTFDAPPYDPRKTVSLEGPRPGR